MSVHLFGVRHHGPGCARSLLQALRELQPDCVLVEGPPEADGLVAFAGRPELAPPVALLLYAAAAPQRAVFYPFATYSPEWQAMRYANEHGVPLRFCDLPQSHRLAEEQQDAPDEVRDDPLRWLAQAAGYGDTETWWDHLVEQRRDSLDLFAAVAEMMTAVREVARVPEPLREQRREAWMRNAIRAAEKEGFARIAVVCGAWHVPALAAQASAKGDATLLKGLPKEKVLATWIPWSYGRLSFASGYGAGVASPGWYHHVWEHGDEAGLFWLTDVAALLRRHDLDASSAQVIEALRLAEGLAALRHRPRTGLDELLEAVRVVFCQDNAVTLRLIERELLVKDRLGDVPADVPTVPLVQDVQALQKRLRLPVRADTTDLDLDLRQGAHLEKSVLLHRLAMIGVQWGRRQQAQGKTGTFHELWRLAWEPEFSIQLIEASVWGATLEQAATARAIERGARAESLPELTALMEEILLADLQGAVEAVMARIQESGAATADAGFLLEAIGPLVDAIRYGTVRGTDTRALAGVAGGLMTRACIALPFGARALADDAAGILLRQLVAGDAAIRRFQDDALLAAWFDTLEKLARSDQVHSLIAGRATRILSEQQHWSLDEAARQLSLRSSRAMQPLVTAQWLEGFLGGGGTLLAQSDALWDLVNAWLMAQPEQGFIELLPLLRRTFGSFTAPERRQLAERSLAGKRGQRLAATRPADLDLERARRVLPVLRSILGNATTAAAAQGE
ncbi:DUF5682 family protein [Massilia sp. IC2-477]|uniref:DUF5682 family protein n=1 Tax=Massilia sp. IC2-477 TaxID=2887198 RepID=UPI001D112F2E|nr:DUF5682 family protein [Massilia sp. IC2-477]MCC2958798.1 DUF5682 family protein [Massilia sp. IC2-477]